VTGPAVLPDLTERPGPVLELRGVSRVYRRGEVEVRALSDVSLQVAAGELVAVMGQSGSGKSTLLNLAGGLDVATSGEVLVDGVAVGPLSLAGRAALRRSRVGYVFQDLNLLAGLTAAENVALPRELDGVRARAARVEAMAMLEIVGMSGVADRFPASMSGGEQQRVAVARALIGARRLLLADEPTGALDSATGEGIVGLLRERCDHGAAVVLVSHEPRYAAWADRVVYIRDGSVLQETTPVPAVGASERFAG
jgi:putative ABC transport system ATP-binding protein